MATSFGALCSDFYVNSKLAMKMDLPDERETVLHLFDRVRRSYPSMDRFRRYDNEFLLESSRRETEYHYLSLRRSSIRAGQSNIHAILHEREFDSLRARPDFQMLVMDMVFPSQPLIP